LSCLSSPRIHHHLSTLFFFTDTPPPELYTLSLHDALPILRLHRLGHLPSLVDVGGVPPLYAVSLAGHTVASIILGTRRICSYKLGHFLPRAWRNRFLRASVRPWAVTPRWWPPVPDGQQAGGRGTAQPASATHRVRIPRRGTRRSAHPRPVLAG